MDETKKYKFQATTGLGFGLVGSSFFCISYFASKESFEAIFSLILLTATFLVFFAWCYLFSKTSITYLDKCFPIALIIMGCGGGLLYLAPDEIRNYTTLAFLVSSSALCVYCFSIKSSFLYRKNSWKFPRELLRKPLIYLFIYGISYGAVIGICSSESILSYSYSPMPTIAIGCILAGVAAFGLALISNTPKTLDIATRVSLGSIVISLLLLLVVTDNYSFLVIATVLSLGIALFLFLYFRMSFDLYETFGFRLITLASSLASFFFAVFCGAILGQTILPASPQIAVIICVLVITIVTLYGLGSNRVWTARGLQAASKDAYDITSSDGTWKKSCSLIAQEYGLSDRETEVFTLLAKGRNAGYIEKKLCISTHTVKAHMLKIYRKLDVHSIQELIDLVEKKKESLKKENL